MARQHMISSNDRNPFRRIEDVFAELGSVDLLSDSGKNDRVIRDGSSHKNPQPLMDGSCLIYRKSKVLHARDARAVWNVGHLFKLCGPWMTALLLGQTLGAVVIACTLRHLYGWNDVVIGAVVWWTSWVMDGVVFYRLRGHHHGDFSRAAKWLFWMTVAPGLLLQCWHLIGEL